VIDQGRKGFLGFGAKEAEVTVTMIHVDEPSVPEILVTPDATTVDLKEEVVEIIRADVQQQVPIEELSDEVAIKETERYLQQVAEGMGIEDVQVSHEMDGKYVNFQLESAKAALLIGKRGQTLNALQQLAQLVTNKSTAQFKVVRVDVGDYRERREQSLEQLADRMADKAARTGRKVQFEPMPSYERKVIHNALSNRLDIETYSEGNDPFRYLVIEAVR